MTEGNRSVKEKKGDSCLRNYIEGKDLKGVGHKVEGTYRSTSLFI